jgi:aspartyl/asparaginyl beta-hydroxylase (cupin superfamily)
MIWIYVIIISVVVLVIMCNLSKFDYLTDMINSYLANQTDDPPILKSTDFPWTQLFRDNYKTIKEEYLSYDGVEPAFKDVNSKYSVVENDKKWKVLFLRAFNKDTKLTKYFPKTMELINSCPCTLAYFSILEPGTTIHPHVGVYKGVIRYHLGLIVPKNYKDCFIVVDGKKLHWKEGEDIMFDDMFEHYVINRTDERRVILFLDIKRDFNSILVNMINSILLFFVRSSDELKDTIDNMNSFVE